MKLFPQKVAEYKHRLRATKGMIMHLKDYELATLSVNHATPRYLGWLRDEEVTRFLEVRRKQYSLDDLKQYISSFKGDKSKFLFGVFHRATGDHVGNGTVYNVNYEVGTFTIGLMIGDKEHWGKTVSMESCLTLLWYGFEKLGMRKFFGGVYANHFASRFVLQRLGCVFEAVLKERFLFEGQPVNQCYYTMTRNQWFEAKRKHNASVVLDVNDAGKANL